jgi:pyruvate/2-oxoglutarate dehydrogenase complex dihydrolipoamide dehydrogenase (E3) component
METITADIAIIGAGSGGLSVAAGASQLGLKVVLFEAGEMGGDCLNTGCVPSKALIAAGKQAHAMRTASRFGIADVAPQVDWSAVKAHVRGVIDTIAPIDSQERFEGFGVRVVRAFARFTGPRTVTGGDVEVTAKRIVLASGGRPFIPPIPGLAETPHLTNETIFAVDPFPRHLIVLGAGPIGIELGQAFARLGAAVTILEAAEPLARFEPEARAVVLEALAREGVTLRAQTAATTVRRTDDGVAVTTSAGDEIEGSHLLVAVGRRANVENIGLEAAGIQVSRNGVVTDDRLRTTNPAVYAVGDVAGREQLTHAAGWHASALVRTLLFRAPTRADAVALPSAVYCEPELAMIGLTEAEARAQHGDAVRCVHWAAAENDRAQAERDTEGFVKIVTGRGGRILGATAVGAQAADLLAPIGLAMAQRLTIRALTGPVAPYPTRGELLKRAAGSFYTPTLFSDRTRAVVRFLWRLP